MSEAAIKKPSMDATFKILILITLLFILLLGYAASYVKSVQPQPVPLNPCRTCSNGCPCPRMAGTVRCGCPQ
jgi:hypothetical protein